MTIDLAAGVRVTVRQPQPPRFTVTPPTATRQVVVPVRGPAGPAGESDIADHINSESPHPIYDDSPSLTLLFENGLI